MFAILIDENGFKIDFDLKEILELKEYADGETIIETDWQIANGMNKPKWDGEKWIDTDPLPPVEVEPSQPSRLDILEQEIQTLKESQTTQDLLIDDIVFEVIPSLESQIATNNQNGDVAVLINKHIEKIAKNKKGSDGMAGYLARKIIEGRDYKAVFKINAYKQYQDEVDTILELEGRSDLIKRGILG